MEIEIKERRWIRCSSLKKKIFYTKLDFVKKTDREEMEVEEERVKKTRNCHKTSVIKARPKTRWWYKTYVKKEMMAIEKIENTEAANKSPPKKGNPGVKTKSKGTSYAPRKKIKKNTPKKSSGGSDLNFNQVKILNQPTTKIILMTDFLKSISKNTYVSCLEKTT